MFLNTKSFGQYYVRWFFALSRACEPLTVFCKAGHKTTMREEELSFLDSHEAVEPIRFARRIMAESGCSQLDPPSLSRVDPLITIKGLP
jgi:hypothetical protein